MKEEIKVPSVGESITTGTVAAWLRRDGERVKEGEKLFELETDKALIEVPCPGTGVLKIEVPEGTDVEIGQTVNSKSLDDRVGVFVMIEAVRKAKKHGVDLYAVASVQEEVGLRGAITAYSCNNLVVSVSIGVDCSN